MRFFRSPQAAHIALGKRGESLAVELFRRRNCTILARNWRYTTAHDGTGELDIVLLDGGTLVFAEVKSRRKFDRYLPGANLSEQQKKRIRRGARAYHRRFRIPDEVNCRFDLVEIIHDGKKLLDITLHEAYMTMQGNCLYIA